MEMTKADSLRLKGMAVLAMLWMHLFQRLDFAGTYRPLLFIGGKPAVYHLGLLADLCVPVFCFCAGYAQHLLREKNARRYLPDALRRGFQLAVRYWLLLLLFGLAYLASRRWTGYDISLRAYLLNFPLIQNGFDSASWFVLTYIFLLLTSVPLLWLCRKLPWWLTLAGFGGIYAGAYFIRFGQLVLPFSGSWPMQQLVLYGCSVFPFVMGVLCRQHRCVSRLRAWLYPKARPWLRNLLGPAGVCSSAGRARPGPVADCRPVFRAGRHGHSAADGERQGGERRAGILREAFDQPLAGAYVLLSDGVSGPGLPGAVSVADFRVHAGPLPAELVRRRFSARLAAAVRFGIASPASQRTPIRFGIAISPLRVSAKFQTASSFMTLPTSVTAK
jgi:hypothetical protein